VEALRSLRFVVVEPKPGPLVLVIDDFSDNRIIYAEFLRFAGLRVKVAASAEEGLTIALHEPPAVVVMDLALPKMDGWEATRRLKSHPRTKDTKILVVTGHVIDELRERAYAAGADEVCTKPCLPIDLLKRVQALMPAEEQPHDHHNKSRTRRRVAR
jgi:CheY-like chemotaxis protein